MADDPELRAHREWLGYLQPVGVVVSPPALTQAQAHVNRNVAARQAEFAAHVVDLAVDDGPDVQVLPDVAVMLRDVMGWSDADLVPGSDAGDLEVVLPEYNDVLRPDFAVPEPEPQEGGSRWQLAVAMAPPGADLDSTSTNGHGWEASPQARLERLLRETGVPAGLLCNGTGIRLVYAPRGESSGHLTFPVGPMTEVAGRPIFAALEMLLGYERFFTLPREQRLPGLLAGSRRYQNEVSVQLAGQVLGALYELLRGLQAADNQVGRRLLAEVLQTEADQVYAGLLSVLLRLVFLLYAEDRGLMPPHELYSRHYSVGGLYDRLRADAGQHPDTMDQRYGAWAHLLAVFRLVHDGTRHGELHLPARHGYLFDPDRYSFLEGRPWRMNRVLGERIETPLISDGVVFRVLRSLLVLDGERLSYRSLDVEQIGSVYETMMGFGLGLATGPSVAIQPGQRHGAPVVVDLAGLLDVPASGRAARIQEETGRKLTPREATALAHAAAVDELAAALEAKIDRRATPNVVTRGAMVLQPGEERRRSGSHYTPRSLTEPIVRRTLEPVLQALGASPPPAAILGLKVLDPAMGSGAFLVEACRQLGEALTVAWRQHGNAPAIPPDEDVLLHAMRLVAQRCLYGVDRNPMATDLAKLSLWLATLARDHPFTFIDHALRSGDSLVGLGRDQIAVFDWTARGQVDLAGGLIQAGLSESQRLRQQVREMDDAPEDQLRLLLREADEAVDDLRLVGDLVVAAFFSASTMLGRRKARDDMAENVSAAVAHGQLSGLRAAQQALRESGIVPFHWQIEFPEVFDRQRLGFDAIIGNPPFLGGTKISTDNSRLYLDWLKDVFDGCGGRTDLVVYFLRQAYSLLRDGGCFGLVATKTVAQGDSRRGGLGVILSEGGTIYAADRRIKWPGVAAVTVSVLHISRGAAARPVTLNGKAVESVNAFLLASATIGEPARLSANRGLAFAGVMPYGQGFFFEDGNPRATPISEMRRLLSESPVNQEVIFPFVGGEEILSEPAPKTRRFVINFGDKSLDEARKWSQLLKIVEERVRPERARKSADVASWPWWKFWRIRTEMLEATANLSEFVVKPHLSSHHAVGFLPGGYLPSHNVTVFAIDNPAGFALLQSRLHEEWVRLTSSGLEDRQGYRATDSFETFPFPVAWEFNPELAAAGKHYREMRDALQVSRSAGLTDVYNWFHDPVEHSADVIQLREMHNALDRAVLDAYGWTDIPIDCEFLLDYESDDDDPSSRRKPWRYRWPDEIGEEVLARLLRLNRDRAEVEAMAGARPESTRGRRGSATKQLPAAPPNVVQPRLLGDP